MHLQCLSTLWMGHTGAAHKATPGLHQAAPGCTRGFWTPLPCTSVSTSVTNEVTQSVHTHIFLRGCARLPPPGFVLRMLSSVQKCVVYDNVRNPPMDFGRIVV